MQLIWHQYITYKSSQSWITLPLSTLNKGVCLKRTGNYFLQLIHFQFLFILQFFFITSHLRTWITVWRNQPTSRLYSVTSFLSSRHLYQGTRYIYEGNTYFSTSILQKWPRLKKKTMEAHMLHSHLCKKLWTFNYGKQSMQGFTIEKVEQKNCVLVFNCLLVATFWIHASKKLRELPSLKNKMYNFMWVYCYSRNNTRKIVIFHLQSYLSTNTVYY